MFAHGFNIHFGTITPPADIDVLKRKLDAGAPSARVTAQMFGRAHLLE